MCFYPNIVAIFPCDIPFFGHFMGNTMLKRTVLMLFITQQNPQTNRDDGNMKHTTPSNESRRTFK